ncbi:MAG: translation initiation factor IF-2 [Candidatus Binatia bacterium]
MVKTRVHILAKELGVETKDLITHLEKMGIRGKKAQSSLAGDEVVRVRAALAAPAKPRVTVGEERVVADRVVTAEDQNMGEIQAHEKVVERRVRANVIRRRTSRIEVSSQSTVPKLEPQEHKSNQTPPEAVPAASPPSGMPLSDGFPAEKAPIIESKAIETPPPFPPETPEVKAKPVGEKPAPAIEEPPRGAKVLGRIDLKQAKKIESQPTPPPESAITVQPDRPVEEKGEPKRRSRSLEAKEAVLDKAEKPAKTTPHKKRVVKKQDILQFRERELRSSRMPRKKRALPGKEQRKTEITVPKASKRVVKMSEAISIGELAKVMGVKAGEVIKKLMELGMMATINQIVDADTASIVAAEFDHQVENVAFDVETALGVEDQVAEPESVLQPRSPVVTIMGHVDHGKTSLLDAIRSAHVTDQEAGGITQHIGAYHVQVDGRSVTFLDTPGHEAFTAMRARGAKVTDIVVLVVAADDGVMPQTIEAINHSRAAEVPIIVAVNKIDKPDANLERVTKGLSEHGLVSEAWGGDTVFVPVSAVTKEGIPQLLEMLLLQADLLELKVNPEKLALGTIVEAKLDRGRGPVATVLVQEGTLRVGDSFVCGVFHGRVRAMVNDRGRKIDQAPPSLPVEILGLQGVPQAGDRFVALADETKAKQVAEFRRSKQRESELSKTSKVSLEELYEQIQAGSVKELRVVVKADVQGAVEALTDALSRLSSDEVKLSVIHGSAGGITESDILLAAASNAIVIGFNVRPEIKGSGLAAQEGVDVRLYTVIYDAIADIKAALEGMLEPVYREQVLGHIAVREIFNIQGVGTVAGCHVSEGKVQRSSLIRLLRDQVVVHEGKLASLKRFKDDMREVATGYECGLSIDGFQDIKVGDVVEAYERVPVSRHLNPTTGTREESRVSAGDER